VPRRSNNSIFNSAWKSRSRRLTAGCVTAISLAASVTLPVSIIARKASTCRELIRAKLAPFITFRHTDGVIIHWTSKARVAMFFIGIGDGSFFRQS
jgi:hypothetical protein